MREIKFRAWDGKEMTDVPVNHSGYRLNELLEGISDNYTLMQYTGLKDKNGVEIYEGDVMDSPRGNIAIVYEIATGFFGNFRDGENPEYYEILGNIYENPELLT